MTEDANGFHIVRTWLFTTKKGTFLPRIMNYLSFSTLACFAGLLAVGSVDVIVVESPPLFLGVAGYFLCELKRAKFVLNISDLWPESAVVLGMLRNPRLIRWATRVEEGLYRRACLVTGQTQGIIDSVRKRCSGTPAELFTNGVAPEFLVQVEAAQTTRERSRADFGFGQKFIVAYTGVFGLAQALDKVIRAAQILSNHEEILFVLWGDGPQRSRLHAMVAETELRNVWLLPLQPASRMAAILTAIDVSIVPLRGHDLFKGALPSKLFEALGAGVPVIAAMEGEARVLVEQSGGGLAVEPENPEEMAEAVFRLYRDPALRKQLGENGREYVARHYNRRESAEKFNRLLLGLIQKN